MAQYLNASSLREEKRTQQNLVELYLLNPTTEDDTTSLLSKYLQ